MPTARNDASPSIETFAATCARLTRGGDAAAVLGEAGFTPDAWERATTEWARRMTSSGADAEHVAERFGRTFAQVLAARLDARLADLTAHAGERPDATDPEPSADVATATCAPELQVPSFLLPPPPAPARSESPWARTVGIDSLACRPPVPFRPSDTPPVIATPAGARSRAEGTGTVPIAELPAPARTVALAEIVVQRPLARPIEEDEDTERTLMAPPVGSWPPVKK